MAMGLWVKKKSPTGTTGGLVYFTLNQTRFFGVAFFDPRPNGYDMTVIQGKGWNFGKYEECFLRNLESWV